MIFARNVNAANSERERVIAKRCARSPLDYVSTALGRPVRIGYLSRNPYNNYAPNLRDTRTWILKMDCADFAQSIVIGSADA
jgi:hypothetical protein